MAKRSPRALLDGVVRRQEVGNKAAKTKIKAMPRPKTAVLFFKNRLMISLLWPRLATSMDATGVL